jgi:hypothetical protein
MYDPNYLPDGTKLVWRSNDRYFDDGADLGAAATDAAKADLGAGPIWRRRVGEDMRRWFRYWLQDEDNGILDEAPIHFIAPSCRPGREPDPETGYEPFRLDDYPGGHVTPRSLFLAEDGRATTADPAPGSVLLRNRLISPVPGDALWIPLGQGTIRHELAFSSAPLPSDLVLMGTPHARLFVSCNATEFALTISVYDVTVDANGSETNADLITRGPTFRFVEIPGEVVDLDVECDFRVHRFEAGHVVRIVISNLDHLLPQRGSYNFWSAPSLVPSDSTVHLGGERASRLDLPVYEKRMAS